MKTKSLHLNPVMVGLALLLASNACYTMPGMDMPNGANAQAPSLAKSLGAPINSDAAEFELTYSADGKTVLFVSTRPGSIASPGNPYSFDIWMAHSVNGQWQTPIALGPGIDPKVGPAINTEAWELEPSLSDDGNAIYFTRYQAGNLSTGDLYVVQKIDGVWQTAKSWNEVTELPALNTPTGEEHCPIIASDSLIYFSYQQPGVTQDSDIWKVEKKNGAWQKPQSLGSRINSPFRDHLHWTGLSKDGKSLVITSMRTDMGSRGGHDEWISHQNPKGEWQEPLNLGDTVNTAGEDMCWSFTPDGKQFFGGWGPQGSYNMDVLWLNKDDVPLLKNFDPIGPPPNLMAKIKAKAVNK
ncbi:PD40 domain-containing protein [Methylomonas sp. ZR1]|jgi:WD40-like Beta Propeller Repeat.|uniref:TolB family protein n=1 Tax=Methylomonas sp. ZR1 TaxID=1797072 RepID=UPI001490C79A|nr:PD40 domain-containing protein [Methylomonas sp. ZR1]NOV29238.1 hypothetical protein [Methylomonas sp. ZR1]